MNTAVISGNVSGTKYRTNPDTNEVEFVFIVVNCDRDKNDEEANKIPVLTKGDFAKICYSEICDGSYVENSKVFYVLANNVVAKLPKKHRQFYMKKKEFLHLYKPSNIIEDIVIGQIDGKDKNE